MTAEEKAPTTLRMLSTSVVTTTRVIPTGRRSTVPPSVVPSPRPRSPASERPNLTPRPSAAKASAERGPVPGWVWPYMIFTAFLLLAGLFLLWTEAHVLGHF